MNGTATPETVIPDAIAKAGKAWMAAVTPIVSAALTEIVAETSSIVTGLVATIATTAAVWLTPNRKV